MERALCDRRGQGVLSFKQTRGVSHGLPT